MQSTRGKLDECLYSNHLGCVVSCGLRESVGCGVLQVICARPGGAFLAATVKSDHSGKELFLL